MRGAIADPNHDRNPNPNRNPTITLGAWTEPALGTIVDALFREIHGGLDHWSKPFQMNEGSCRRPTNCTHFNQGGQWKEHPSDVAAAGWRCAPSFIIPGTQKGASTFLFHALSRHPQVPARRDRDRTYLPT